MFNDIHKIVWVWFDVAILFPLSFRRLCSGWVEWQSWVRYIKPAHASAASIVIDDLPATTSFSTTLMFAVCRWHQMPENICSISDCRLLQKDLLALSEWSTTAQPLQSHTETLALPCQVHWIGPFTTMSCAPRYTKYLAYYTVYSLPLVLSKQRNFLYM